MEGVLVRSIAIACVAASLSSGCTEYEALVKQYRLDQQRVAVPVIQSPAAPAAKVTIPIPQWRAGDEWVYSDGYALRVSQVEPNGVARFARTDEPSQWFTRRGFFREESRAEDGHRVVVYRTGDPMTLYAAAVNQPVTYVREYMRNGELVRHRTSWVIEGRERIAVPAGTFDCWVVVMRTESLDGNWRAFERWYYSPDVRNYVRLEFKYGESPDASRVLVSYKLAN